MLVEDGLEAALREEAKSACNRAALVACEVTSELDGRPDPVVEARLPLTDPAEWRWGA